MLNTCRKQRVQQYTLSSPLKLSRADVKKVELANVQFESSMRQWFSETVCDLVCTLDRQQCNNTFLKLLSNQMAIYLQVFCALMEDGVFGNMDCRSIITE